MTIKLLGTQIMTFVVFAVCTMALTLLASNILVEVPINDWITYGALTYPICFLITDLVNRTKGIVIARYVVLCGFVISVALSFYFADPRIAAASGTAFLISQLLDVTVFHYLRQQSWWKAPLVSSSLASLVDTALFFSLAFAGTGLPWITWGIGDLGVKIAVALAMLVPFRLLSRSHLFPTYAPVK